MTETKAKTFTTSQLASICGVSVASASTYIQKHHLKPVKTGEHNSKYYDTSVLSAMKSYYRHKAKSGQKQRQTTKDDVIEQLQARIADQADTINLLKQQLSVKDEQIATANRIADQAQQLDLTTHK